jgi:hypothetical protein
MKSIRSSKNTLIYWLFFFIVPNLFFYVLSHYIFIVRALVNVDYLLLGVLTYFLPFVVSYILFILIFVADFIYSILPSYHFTDANILKSLQHVVNINLTLVCIGAVIAFIALYFILKYLKSIANLRSALLCLTTLLLIVAIDMIFEKNKFGLQDNLTIKLNMVSSAIHKTVAVSKKILRVDNPPLQENVASASKIIFENLQSEHLPTRIVYVITESIGHFKEKAANDLQYSAFDQPKLLAKYTFHRGAVPFTGTTVPGEIRELCRMHIDTVHPKAQHLPSDHCLIAQLQDLGFHTTAYHGFTGAFFNRLEWYPKVGFDEILFINEIDEALEIRTRCGTTFKGACDTEITDLVTKKLLDKDHDKVFIYWLTLNTHLPIPPNENNLNCNRSEATKDYDDICTSVKQHDLLFKEIATLAANPALPPTLFVLVGDHAPPYLAHNRRDLFVPGEVPYLILWPNQ